MLSVVHVYWKFDEYILLSFQLRLDKPEKIKVRKAFGGHKKIKGIKVKTGLYVCNSLGKVCLLWWFVGAVLFDVHCLFLEEKQWHFSLK